MIALEQPRRVNQVGALHRVQNVGDGHARGEQLRRIRLNVKLRLLSALKHHARNPIQPVQTAA